MRSRIIALSVVAALALTVCLLALGAVYESIGQLESLAAQSEKKVSEGDDAAGADALERFGVCYDRLRPVLETLTPHVELHNVKIHLTEAEHYLSAGRAGDYFLSMALLREMLSHLREQENFSWSNIL